MRRIALIVVVLAAAAAVVVAGTGSGPSGGTYKVRAIFDDAVSIIPGELVRSAGVNIGTVSGLDVTPQKKAAVIISITDPGFKDFRQDAHCTIRDQSLIGEKFVDCQPTQPKPVGSKPSPELAKIPKGRPGAGQYLLSVKNTSTPVDIDLIADINRLPYRQRLSLIVGELGTGLAGNADQLRLVIHRADPALQNLDKVLAILANQNQTLAQLATNSDAILGPLARDKSQVADFVDKASQVAAASADRRGDLQRDIQKLPGFLQQITPTSQALGRLADAGTPVLASLHSNAPSINRVIEQIKPFSSAALPALQSLGAAADIGGPALQESLPLTKDLRSFGAAAKPLGANLAALTTSLQSSGGIERALDYVFYQVAAINGYDSFGHYLRAGLLGDNPLCSAYATTPTAGCSSNFGNGAAKTTQATSASKGTLDLSQYAGDTILQDTARVLMGESPATVLRDHPLTKQDKSSTGPATPSTSSTSSTTTTTPSTPAVPSLPATGGTNGGGSSQSNPLSGLLNYLVGGNVG